MEDNTRDLLKDFVKSVLDDDHGISRKSYNSLEKLINEIASRDESQWRLMGILNEVRSTEDRYYLPLK